MIIEYFKISNFVRKHQASFYNVFVLHKQTLFDSGARKGYTWFIIHRGALSSPNALTRFVATCATLPRQLRRNEVWNSLAISTPTSQQIQMEILVEKREELEQISNVLSQGSNFNFCRNYSLRVDTGVKVRFLSWNIEIFYIPKLLKEGLDEFFSVEIME